MPSMQKRPANKNPAVAPVLTNPAAASHPSMDQTRVEEAAKQRAKLDKADMQRRARAQAVHEYVTGPALEVAANPPVTPVQRKRTMRNKSAFISRQTQRHYQRFLSDHIRNAEMERDAAWEQKESIEAQIAGLRNLERLLQNRLSANAVQSAPERPKTAGSSSRFDLMRGASSALRSRSTPAGDARFHAPPTTYATALPQSTATSTTFNFNAPSTTYTTGASRPASTTAPLSFGIPSTYGGRPRGAPNISTGFTAPNVYEPSATANFPISAGYAPSVSRATSNTGFDALFDGPSPAHYSAAATAPLIFSAPSRAGVPRARGVPTTSSTPGKWGGTAANLMSSSSLPVSSATFMAGQPSLPTTESSAQEMFLDEFGDWAAPQTTPSQPPASRQDSYP